MTKTQIVVLEIETDASQDDLKDIFEGVYTAETDGVQRSLTEVKQVQVLTVDQTKGDDDDGNA